MTLYAGWLSVSSGGYSTSYVDPALYTSSSNYNQQYVSSYASSSSQYYIYLTFATSGTKTIYYRNYYGSSTYSIYFGMYNVTTGTTIKSNSSMYNSSFTSYSFDVNAGDVIRINMYDYNGYSSYFEYYFSGADKPQSDQSSIAESSISLKVGKQCTVVAEPKSGYLFSGWYRGNDLVSTEATYTYTMIEGNDQLVAKWAIA